MARRLEVTIVGNSRDLERAFGKSASAASAFGANMVRLGAVAAGAAAAGLGVAVAKAVDFDRGMRNVNSIAKLSEKQLAALSKETLKLAGPTGQAPKVLTAGLYDIVSSGFKAKDAIKILGVSAKAATAGMTDTATSTKAVTAALNAYHLGAGQARKVSDILFTTVNKGVLTFEELAQNMGDLVPAAAPLGISLEEVGAAMSTVTLQGVPAAEAATRVKNTMLQLAKPSAALSGLLKDAGFASGEAAIKSKGFAGVLQILQNATKGSVTETSKLTPEIRSLLGVVGLTGKNLATYNEHLTAHQDASKGAGAAALAFAEQSKSVGVQWDKAKASLNVLAIEIGSALLPAMASVLAWTQAHWPEISAAVERAMGVVKAAVGGAIGFIRDHWGTILPVIKTGFTTMQAIVQTGFNTIKTVAQATFGFLKTDAGQTFAAMAIGAVVVVKLGQAFLAVKAAVLAARAAMIALSLTNPVGVIGLAVGALAGILLKEFGPAILGTRGHLLTTAEAARSLASAVRSASAALDAMKQADLSVDQAKLNLKRTTVDLRREEQEYAAVVHKSGAKSKEGVAALDELKQARLNNRQSVLDLKTAEDQQAKAHAKHGEAVAKTGDVYRKLNQQYQDTVTGLDSVIPKQSVLNKHYQSQAATEYAVKTQDLANRYADLSVKVARSDPVMAKAAAKNALVTQTAHDLTVKLNRVPTKQELKFAVEARSLPGFLESLGKLPIVSKRKATEASRGLNDGLSPFAGIAQKHARAGTAAISGQAGPAFSAGFGTGSSAGQGYAAGLDAQVGAVRSAAARLIQAGKIAAAAAQKSHSESQVYRQLGGDAVDGYVSGIKEKQPQVQKAAETIGQGMSGVLMGFLMGTATLPEKMSERLKTAFERAKQTVDNFRPTFTSAWARVAEDAFRAFDAQTERLVGGLDRQLDTARARIDANLAAISADVDRHLAKLDASIGRKREAKTPAEKELEAERGRREAEGQVRSEAEARKALAKAQAGGDPEEIIAAEQRLQDVLSDIRIAALEKQAAAERAAKEKALTAEETRERAKLERVRKSAEREAALAQATAEKDIARRRLELQAQRDLERRHLEDQLTVLERHLERHPAEWRKVHTRVLGLFENEFGPNFATAGKNLGTAFARGLTTSFSAMDSAAQKFAQLIAAYLKTKSPTKKGPMRDLDKWAAGFASTWVKGMDMGAISKAVSGIGTPALAGVGAARMGRGGMAMAGGGGALHVHLHGPVYGGDRRKIAEDLAADMDRALTARGLRIGRTQLNTSY